MYKHYLAQKNQIISRTDKTSGETKILKESWIKVREIRQKNSYIFNQQTSKEQLIKQKARFIHTDLRDDYST